MNKQYKPKDIEKRIFESWEKDGCFSPKDSNSKFSIVLPPPNVTGTLHMGHAFQHTIIDVLVRYHRMLGKSVLWQPGTDHAGIATQLVVENRIKNSGKDIKKLNRKEFIEEVWKWKELSGNTIVNQTKRLGSSADWSRNRFTMDEGLSKTVQKIFIELYDEGLIYRGNRLVNWDIKLQTAVSDLEVLNEEKDGFLYYLEYKVVDSTESVTVATTRPETFFGDTAVCINPDDSRYNHLIGKEVMLPMINRKIPIIGDDYVDMEFGTGCLKITPAHDFNDFQIGKRHNLPVLNILNMDGTLNKNVPDEYQGLSTQEARNNILKELEELGHLNKTEPYKVQIPRSERSNSVLQPLVTNQWFVDVEKLSKEAIRVVKEDETQFIPKNWENTYFNWMNEIQDWCISRQLWWGHRIPAWFDDEGNIFVGASEKEIRKKYDLDDRRLKQEDDVLDTWFSSALWTFSTLGWPKEENLLSRYHPTSVLVTGFDIIFFWVARMIMMTTHFINEVPFKKILIHGLIKDAEGQKMSKSKGNTIDPLDIIDGINLDTLIDKRTQGLMQPKMKERIIKQTKKEFPEGIKPYGTDALRLTFCSLASGGRDINFDIKRVEGYRNFCNKLWNAARFINLNIEKFGVSNVRSKTIIDAWIDYKFDETLKKVNKSLDEFRFDLATKAIYEFIWYEFCDWFIELHKINLNNKNSDNADIVRSMVYILEKTLRMAHPIMPFITEEIWQQLKPHLQSSEDSIMICSYPSELDNKSKPDYETIEWLKNIVSGIRNIRGELLIKPSLQIPSLFKGEEVKDKDNLEKVTDYVCKLCNLEVTKWIEDESEDPPSSIFIHNTLKVMIPLEGLINPKEESERLLKKISKVIKEKEMLEHKLSNKSFVDNAPKDLVDDQQKRFNVLSQELENLNNQIIEIKKLL